MMLYCLIATVDEFIIFFTESPPSPAQAHEFGPGSQSYEAQALPGRAQAPGFDPGPALNITIQGR